MATKLEIINKTLNYLGQPSVNTLDTGDDVINALSNLYESEKKDLLASTAWSFAKKWDYLVQTTNTPIDETYKYEYNLPTDYITMRQIYPFSNYEILSGKVLYSNIGSKLKIQYIYDVDASQFPPYFTKLMAYALAAEGAMLVTQNVNLAQLWSQKYTTQKAIAQNRDATAQPSQTIAHNPIYSSHWT